jgi:hypothetical protein
MPLDSSSTLGGVGGGSLSESVPPRRADGCERPSTPARLVFPKRAANTIGSKQPLGSSWLWAQDAAPTATSERICLFAASRVRFAGLQTARSPPLTPLRGANITTLTRFPCNEPYKVVKKSSRAAPSARRRGARDETYQLDRRGARGHATQRSGRAVGLFTTSQDRPALCSARHCLSASSVSSIPAMMRMPGSCRPRSRTAAPPAQIAAVSGSDFLSVFRPSTA